MPTRKSNAPPPATREPMLNTKQAAELLGMPFQTLINYRYQGIGPAFCIIGSRAVRYRQEDLDAYLLQQRVSTVSQA